MIDIRLYDSKDEADIIKLVLHCQNDGSRPLISLDNQQDLLDINEKYLVSGGCFWVACDDGNVCGSIGLINYGNGYGILKKFFVYEKYRGKPNNLGQKLYAVLIEFAKNHGIKKIILDTPKNTDRAHNFYYKAGFKKITCEELPFKYDYPYKDSDFFILEHF